MRVHGRFVRAGRGFRSHPDVSLPLSLSQYLDGGESRPLLLNLVPKDNPADQSYVLLNATQSAISPLLRD